MATKSELERRADALLAELTRVNEAIGQVAARPQEPVGFEDGTAMIMAVKSFSHMGKSYTYGAVRTFSGQWFPTGRIANQSFEHWTWDELMDFLYEGAYSLDIWVSSEMTPVDTGKTN